MSFKIALLLSYLPRGMCDIVYNSHYVVAFIKVQVMEKFIILA